MKMKKLIVSSLVLALSLVLGYGSAFAIQGSKFAAHVAQAGENLHLLHSGVAEAVESGVPVESDDTDRILHTTIRTANKKDLLIGVSLQSGLYTDTKVKGKLGSAEQAGAEAGIEVRVEIDGNNSAGGPAKAYPESVVYASRIQKLTATLGGVIESCQVNVDLVDTNGDEIPDSGSGEIIIGRDCEVTDEEIGLMLGTTSANHFNFVAPDLAPGDHRVTVWARALSSAEFNNGSYTEYYCEDGSDPAGGTCDDGAEPLTRVVSTTDNEAKAWALVDVGSLTVEQVRAINQEGGIVIDLDAGN
jgi:hypothetical protein